MRSYNAPRTDTVTRIKCFPLPAPATRNRFACPRLKRASSCQKRVRNAVMTMNSGMIMKRKSLFGKSSISSVRVEPVIAPLSAFMIDSSAMPILYQMHAVMNAIARRRPVTKRQM